MIKKTKAPLRQRKSQPTAAVFNEATHEHWHEKPLKKRDDLGRPSRFAEIRKRISEETPKSFPQKLCFSLRKPNAQLRCEARDHDT